MENVVAAGILISIIVSIALVFGASYLDTMSSLDPGRLDGTVSLSVEESGYIVNVILYGPSECQITSIDVLVYSEGAGVVGNYTVNPQVSLDLQSSYRIFVPAGSTPADVHTIVNIRYTCDSGATSHVLTLNSRGTR